MANTKKQPVKTASDVTDIAALSAGILTSVAPSKKHINTAPAEKGEANRANWTGNLVFGTLTVAVKTFKATDTEVVKLNQIHIANKAEIAAAEADLAAGKKVSIPAPQYGQVKRGEGVSALTGNKVAAEDILSGYQYAEGQWVVVTEDEKKACMVGSDQVMTIQSFVPASKIDPIYFESAEYIAPDTKAEVFKAVFGLLRATMVDRGVVAIAKCNQRGREQTLILRPYGENGMTIHFMYFDNEVRSFNKWASVAVTADQIAAAGKLVDAMTEDTFDATEYEDGYMRAYKGLINAKIDGTAVPVTVIPAAPIANPKVDIMAQLAASLASVPAKRTKKYVAA